MTGPARIFLWLLCGLALLPRTLQAHPHEFVDTTLVLRFDAQGRLAAVSVEWLYDDLTSLLILEDQGMDADGDGRLTDAEQARLSELAGEWPEGYGGNLYLTAGERPVALSGPVAASAGMRDGRLLLTHDRLPDHPLDPLAAAITLQAYDPSYYTFYDLTALPEVTGRDRCHVISEAADLARAEALYDAALAELTDEEMMEEGKFPEIGGAFAPMLRLTCAALP